MSKTATVVYTGKSKQFSLHRFNKVFPQGVPITVNANLLHHLPSEDFEEYNSSKHKTPKDIKPILITMPRTLTEFLAARKSVLKLREFYPVTPITALCITSSLGFLLQDIPNVSVVSSYKVNPGQYFKEFNTKVYPDSVPFAASGLMQHTREFCYLQLLGLQYGDNPIKPTLLKNNLEKTHITLIPFGLTVASTWTDLASYLKTQKYPYELKVLDSKASLKTNYELLASSHYVISTGDSEYNNLAAYLGVPMFAFLNSMTSAHVHQLMKFNNIEKQRVIYSPFVPAIDKEKIRDSLIEVITRVTTGTTVEVPKPVQVREVITINTSGVSQEKVRERRTRSKTN